MRPEAAFGVLLVLALAEPAVAQQTQPESGEAAVRAAPGPRLEQRAAPQQLASDGMQSEDQEFLRTVGLLSVGQAELSKLALERAESEPIRQFALRLAQDYTALGKQASELARITGGKLDGLKNPWPRLHDRLGRLSGREFDRAYVRIQMDLSAQVEHLFAQPVGNDRVAIQQRIKGTYLPLIRRHREMALSLHAVPSPEHRETEVPIRPESGAVIGR